MDKKILQDYIDACELLKETEKDIRRLKQKKNTIIQDSVKGSSHEYPYIEQHYKVQGTAFTVKNDSQLRFKENLLEQRRANAEMVKLRVEEWMLTLPLRIQRIVKYKYLDGMSWGQVAGKMGRNASADSVRMELNNFLK